MTTAPSSFARSTVQSTPSPSTPWETGRFDARSGPQRLLFGRMYEDAAVEAAAFSPGGRIFCIASAGCTAMKLAPAHEVVAVDVNPVQLAYAQRRFAGAGFARGTAERLLGFGRSLARLAGWRRPLLRAFLDLDDIREQIAFWRENLDTRRFRAGFDGLLSMASLRRVYAAEFLDDLPQRLGPLLRARMEHAFATHPNRTNPYARALLLGESVEEPPPPEAKSIRTVCADAAGFLEGEPRSSFHGFALSNVLDGADARYERRLLEAVRRAAAPGAVTVLRSFREPRATSPTNRVAEDRSMLWGIVDVRSAGALQGFRAP